MGVDAIMRESPKNRLQKPLKIVLAVSAIGFFLILLFILALVSEYHPTLGTISYWASLEFPRGTRLINCHTWHGWGDHAVYAKIEMNRKDVDGFIESLPKWTGNIDQDMGPDHTELPWWNPESARNSRVIVISDRERSSKMLLQLDDPKKPFYTWNFFRTDHKQGKRGQSLPRRYACHSVSIWSIGRPTAFSNSFDAACGSPCPRV